MKIIIKDENGQLAICSENEKPISESRIWATLSLALASSIADRIQQKNLPPELKKSTDRDHQRKSGSRCQRRFCQNRKQQHKRRDLPRQRSLFYARGLRLMTGQKERACPCGHTDKLKENIETLLTPEYSTDQEWLQYAGILYYAVDGHGHKFQASTVLRLNDPQLGELIHWLHYHLKGSNPPPALYHLEMLLNNLEYLRGGRHYLYNSIYQITRLEAYP